MTVAIGDHSRFFRLPDIGVWKMPARLILGSIVLRMRGNLLHA